MSYTDDLQAIVARYRNETRNQAAIPKEIAAWAIRKGLWQPQPGTLISQCARELRRAMRDQHITDPQGRSIRAWHSAKVADVAGKQQRLWKHVDDASRDFMRVSFQGRRLGIFSDCRQLKIDQDSFNENHCPDEPINLIFDFTRDLEEDELAAS